MTNHLTPGPEMDAAVAKALGLPCMDITADGWSDIGRPAKNGVVYVGPSPHDSKPFSPSTDIADAIEALEETHRDWNICVDRVYCVGIETVTVAPGGGCDPEFWAGFAEGDTLPEAACRAILAWAEGGA